MSDNNNNKKPERPNPFGSYPYPITNASRTGNNNQRQENIDGLKVILNAEIGFMFLKEKMKLERTEGGEDAVAKIDEYTQKLKDKYIENWETNVQGKAEFMTNGRLDKNKILAGINGSALGLLHPSNKKGGRRTRGKKRSKSRKKRRKSRRKSRRRKRTRKRRKSRRRKRR